MRNAKHGVLRRTCGLGVVALLGASACSPKPAAPPPAEKTRVKPPVIDLAEKAVFPLPKHLESKDIAAGTIQHAQLVEDGAQLFGTSFNGLDGVACSTPSPAAR